MRSEPLDDQYLKWLYSQVDSPRRRSPSKTFWGIFRALFTKEFVWVVPNDDNRVEDGRALRYEFVRDAGIDNPDPEWMSLGCSMLEMLLGLSRRLAFETDDEPRDWFWHLLRTLNLADYNDATPFPVEEVSDILEAVIWRTYSYDGTGGLFPLRNPCVDQRKVEIWYQLSAYLLEQE